MPSPLLPPSVASFFGIIYGLERLLRSHHRPSPHATPSLFPAACCRPPTPARSDVYQHQYQDDSGSNNRLASRKA